MGKVRVCVCLRFREVSTLLTALPLLQLVSLIFKFPEANPGLCRRRLFPSIGDAAAPVIGNERKIFSSIYGQAGIGAIDATE